MQAESGWVSLGGGVTYSKVKMQTQDQDPGKDSPHVSRTVVDKRLLNSGN